MDKIKNTHLNHLRNDEHFQFIEFALALTKEVGAAALRVEPQNAALAAVHREEDEALKKIAKSALTARYADFTRRLNERIDLVNQALAVRRGRAAAERAKKKATEETKQQKQ